MQTKKIKKQVQLLILINHMMLTVILSKEKKLCQAPVHKPMCTALWANTTTKAKTKLTLNPKTKKKTKLKRHYENTTSLVQELIKSWEK